MAMKTGNISDRDDAAFSPGRPAPLALLRRLHLPTLVSFVVAGGLVLVGILRVLSYSRSLAAWLFHGPILGLLAYDPQSLFSVRYFKILASLSAISLLYFVFRFFNRGLETHFPPGYACHHRPVDFSSPWIRLALLLVVNLHWVFQEWYKFATLAYPYSPLESWRSNAVVLSLSGLVAFFGMKYLSFAPLLQEDASHADRA